MSSRPQGEISNEPPLLSSYRILDLISHAFKKLVRSGNVVVRAFLYFASRSRTAIFVLNSGVGVRRCIHIDAGVRNNRFDKIAVAVVDGRVS